MDENNKPSKRASVTTLTSKAVDERSKWLVKISLHFQVLLRPAKLFQVQSRPSPDPKKKLSVV